MKRHEKYGVTRAEYVVVRFCGSRRYRNHCIKHYLLPALAMLVTIFTLHATFDGMLVESSISDAEVERRMNEYNLEVEEINSLHLNDHEKEEYFERYAPHYEKDVEINEVSTSLKDHNAGLSFDEYHEKLFKEQEECSKASRKAFLEESKIPYAPKKAMKKKPLKKKTSSSNIYDTPSKVTFKAYMDYKAITARSSYQWKLQQHATTDINTGIRMVSGRYCVAIGSAYGAKIGDHINVTLSSGKVLNCIMGDQKADKDTDSTNRMQASNGSVLEFVVDTSAMSRLTRRAGDVSYAGEDFKGYPTKIEVLKKSFFGK